MWPQHNGSILAHKLVTSLTGMVVLKHLVRGKSVQVYFGYSLKLFHLVDRMYRLQD